MKTKPTPGPMAVTQWQLPCGTKHVALVSRTDPTVGAVALFGAVGDHLHERSQADAEHFARCVNGHREAIDFACMVLEEVGYVILADESSRVIGFRAPHHRKYKLRFDRAAQWMLEYGYAHWALDGAFLKLDVEPNL